jgi:hypothetical protein
VVRHHTFGLPARYATSRHLKIWSSVLADTQQWFVMLLHMLVQRYYIVSKIVLYSLLLLMFYRDSEAWRVVTNSDTTNDTEKAKPI